MDKSSAPVVQAALCANASASINDLGRRFEMAAWNVVVVLNAVACYVLMHVSCAQRPLSSLDDRRRCERVSGTQRVIVAVMRRVQT